MNKIKSYIIGVTTALALATSFTACQDHFDSPVVQAPVATMKANTTIEEIKQWMWRDATNYCETVYTRDYYEALERGESDPSKTDGDHVIIAGRVISSDYAGNCFRFITLQDETGAMNISIYSYNLYLNYRRGQEVVVDLTGLHMGKYAGLLEVGAPDNYGGALQTSFMAPEVFNEHSELNGMPEINKVDTIVLPSLDALGTGKEDKLKYQCQLVRFNNVQIQKTNGNTLSKYHESISQTLLDADGNESSVVLYTSGYSNFWNDTIPDGAVDIVGIASCYESGSKFTWQIILLDRSGIITDPTLPKGSQGNPYTIGEVIDIEANPDNTSKGWVTGYIVGSVAPEVSVIDPNDENANDLIDWSANPIVDNTMVIGPTPDCKNIAQCLVIELTQGTDLYNQSLANAPGNYQKRIDIFATKFTPVMGAYGIETTGVAADFLIEDMEAPASPVVENFDTTIAFPQKSADASSDVKTVTSNSTGITYEYMGCYVTTYSGSSALMLNGKNFPGAYVQFALPFNCSQIKMLTSSSCSTNAKSTINFYANGVKVIEGFAVNAQSTTFTLDIPAEYRASGTVYKIESNTTEVNQQFVSFTYVPEGSEGSVGGNPGGNPGGSDTDTNGHGTFENPLTVAQTLDFINGGYTGVVIVKGIVTKVTYFNSNYGSVTYYIADAAGSTTELQVYGGLSFNGDKFSGKEDVEIGATVIVEGDVKLYNGTPEVNQNSKLLSYTSPGGGGSTDTPSTPSGIISVAEAIALIQQGSTATVKVSGVVSEVQKFYDQYGQIDYLITDEGGSEALKIYNGLGLNSAKFTSINDVEVGAKVVVEGPLTSYNGTPELNRGNFLVSYTAPEGGSSSGGSGSGGDNPGTTTPPAGDGTLETFSTNAGFPSGTLSNIPTQTPTSYTSSVTGITYTLCGCYIGTSSGSSFLMIPGKAVNGAYVSFSLGYNCKQLVMTTSSGGSTNPNSIVNVYANDTLIAEGLAVSEQNHAYTVDVPAELQAAGTTFKVESATNSYNQQFVSFQYVK